MIVADYIAKFLADHHIRYVFGYQGGSIARIIDSICLARKTIYIQNYHEQASAFAASGYAKTNYDVGVAIATSGPGAINLMGGIADAYCDSVPCLFITGQDYTQNIKNPCKARLNGFQDLDIVSIVKPITKYAVLITNEHSLSYELEKCYHIAKTGRCGPVLIDIPLDIQFKQININKQKKFIYTNHNVSKFEINKIEQVIQLLKSSKKPVILCGGGIKTAKAKLALSKLIDKLKVPIVATSNGLDVNNNIIGFSGLHGGTAANLIILNADLLIVLGARLGQRQVGKIKEKYTLAKIVHIDIDKAELGRVFKESIQINCDLKIFLDALNKKLLNHNILDFNAWKLQVQSYQNQYSKNVYCNVKSKLDPVMLVEKISNIISENAILTLDVGQNQMWVSQGIKLQNNQKLLSGIGYGSMGCSIPYAIGAYFACSNKKAQIISFNGDGGIQMNLQELMLISDKKLNIKIIILNNAGLGLIREAQNKYMKHRHYGTNKQYFKCVNLKLLSKAYGIPYIKISTLKDVNKNLKNKMQQYGPCIIEAVLSEHTKLLNRYDDYKNLAIK